MGAEKYKEFEEIWDNLNKAELASDKIEFAWKSTIESNNNIETKLDRNNSKATVLLTISIALLGLILPILIGIIFESEKIIPILNSILINIDWLKPQVALGIFELFLSFSSTCFFFSSMFFMRLLTESVMNKDILRLSPAVFFSNIPYDDSIKTKIRLIPTLEMIAYKKYQTLLSNRIKFLMGSSILQIGFIFFAILLIIVGYIISSYYLYLDL